MIDEFKDLSDVDGLINKLLEDYGDETDYINKIKPLITEIESSNDKGKISDNVEQLQGINNRLYSIKNTEMLIELQVIINEFRNKYDITDPREVINVDNGKGYVQ